MKLNVYLIAIAAAAACGTISVKCALSFFASEIRLFTAVALAALAWLMLLPYYGELMSNGGKDTSNASILMTAFGGYLLIVVAGLLCHSATDPGKVDVMDRYALALLVPLATGSKPDLLNGLLNNTQFETLIATSLAAAGYVRLWQATRVLKPPPGASRVMTTVAFMYAGLELVYLVFQLRDSLGPAMGTAFVLSFAIAKLLLTGTLLYILIIFLEPKKKFSEILGDLVS